MSSSAAIVCSSRLAGIDRLRGLAILLMVIDHISVIIGPNDFFTRRTITRLALPIFCIIAGSLFKASVNWARMAQLFLAGVLASVIGLELGMPMPDVVLIIGACLVVLPYCSNLWALVLAIIQAQYWRLGWSGYEPGFVLAFLIIGKTCVPAFTLHEYGMKLPRSIEEIGRYPLAVYLGHLLALLAVSTVWHYDY